MQFVHIHNIDPTPTWLQKVSNEISQNFSSQKKLIVKSGIN